MRDITNDIKSILEPSVKFVWPCNENLFDDMFVYEMFVISYII